MTTKAELERRLIEAADEHERAKDLELHPSVIRRERDRVATAALALADAIRDEPSAADERDRLRAENERLREGLRAETEALSEQEFIEWSYNNAMAGFCHQLRERLTALLNDTADQTAGGDDGEG